MFASSLLTLLLCNSDPHAQAQQLVQELKEADWAAALTIARQLEALAAEKAPLEIVEIQTIAGPPRGLGMYTALYRNRLQSDELVVYAQVRNHGLKKRAELYELHLVSDLVVLDKTGAEIARDEGFGESRFTSRAQHRDTFVVIAMGTRGLPGGKYTLRLVLHDRILKKTARAEVPFEIP